MSAMLFACQACQKTFSTKTEANMCCGGKKFDTGKRRWDLAPMLDGFGQIVDVLTFGAEKYGDRNWEAGMGWSRCYAAALRHLTAWHAGEDSDSESGLSHLAHAGCCVVFLLAYQARSIGTDDRPTGSETPKPEP